MISAFLLSNVNADGDDKDGSCTYEQIERVYDVKKRTNWNGTLVYMNIPKLGDVFKNEWFTVSVSHIWCGRDWTRCTSSTILRHYMCLVWIVLSVQQSWLFYRSVQQFWYYFLVNLSFPPHQSAFPVERIIYLVTWVL